MKIRKATTEDIPDLVSLMEQLGYPTSVENMSIRIKNIESNSSYHTLVADYDGKLLVWQGYVLDFLMNLMVLMSEL